MTLNEKAPAPVAAGGEGQGISTRSKSQFTISLRSRRLLAALLSGPITREQADAIAKASNSPHWIMELRRKGLAIECKRQKKRDGDGAWIYPGIYTLSKQSVTLAVTLLGGCA